MTNSQHLGNSEDLEAPSQEPRMEATQITYYTMGGTHIKNLTNFEGFPGGTAVENLPASAGDTGSSPGLGRSHMPRSD